jgi:hypothetical protein
MPDGIVRWLGNGLNDPRVVVVGLYRALGLTYGLLCGAGIRPR